MTPQDLLAGVLRLGTTAKGYTTRTQYKYGIKYYISLGEYYDDTTGVVVVT